ncbi:hypothetical protein GGR54DRAFT_48030 [Hypoxylon sp. NC1633]|nr:hypothetical protein GGR54DRAFT_48030 [Hypoxylon sp. NC1633]
MLATRLALPFRHGATAVGRGRLVSSYSYSFNSHTHLIRPSTRAYAMMFSTTRSVLESKQPPKQDPSKNPDIPGFSFEGLGMSRNAKIAVIVILSIYGTMESLFYIRWIWRWFEGSKDGGSESKT